MAATVSIPLASGKPAHVRCVLCDRPPVPVEALTEDWYGVVSQDGKVAALVCPACVADLRSDRGES